MKLSQLLLASSLLVGCGGESNLGDTTASSIPPPNTRWAISFGGDDSEGVTRTKLDSAGNVVAIGVSLGHSGPDGGFALGSRFSFITKRAAVDGAEL